MAIKAKLLPNGPIQLSGDLGELELTDPTGASVALPNPSKIFLCRCGGSVTKPFCDGTHSKIGFQAAEAAVRGV